MNQSCYATRITATNLALKTALQLVISKPIKSAIASYYGKHKAYSQDLLDLVCAFLEVPIGWTRIAKVKLPSIYDQDKVNAILALAKRLGLDAHVRQADNGRSKRAGSGRFEGTWDHPLEKLDGYEEWSQIEIDRYVHDSQANSGARQGNANGTARFVEIETLHDALQLALHRRFEYWKSEQGKLDILGALPCNNAKITDIKALVGDIDAFTKLTASFLAEYESGNFVRLVTLPVTEGAYEMSATATSEDALSDEAREILTIGRLLGHRVVVRSGNNGASWREDQGRFEGTWDHPLNKHPGYLEWVEMEISASLNK